MSAKNRRMSIRTSFLNGRHITSISKHQPPGIRLSLIHIWLMHTLFTLADRYGLEVCECEDEVHLRVHIHKGRDAAELHRMLSAWGAVAAKLKAGEITKEEYDRWRYRYPELDTSGQWHKITPSQELSDLLLEEMKHE